MEEYLIKTANYFFPQNVDGFDEKYLEKIEIQRLNKHLTDSINQEYGKWLQIIANFNDVNYTAIDYTNFLLSQPSLHLKIVIENDSRFVKTFNLFSSLVIPYYYFSEKVYDNLEKCYFGREIINKVDCLDIRLLSIVHEVAGKLNKKQIDEKYLIVQIPNISFEEIEIGNFTVMNAFFNPKQK